MGARLDAREERFTPLVISGRPLRGIEYALPVASAQVKSCVLLAGPARRGRDHRRRARAEPRPHRAAADRRGRRPDAATATGSRSRRPTRSSSRRSTSRATRRRPRSTSPPPRSCRARGSTVTGMAANWTRVGFFRILERMGAALTGALETRATAAPDAEPLATLEVAHGPLTAHARDRGRGPARDRRAAARRAARLLRRGRDGRRGRAGAAAQGVRPDRDRRRRPARARRRHRGDRRRLRGARHRRAARRHDRRPRRPPAGDARRGRRAGEPRAASRSSGMEAAAVSYPGFAADLAALTG